MGVNGFGAFGKKAPGVILSRLELLQRLQAATALSSQSIPPLLIGIM
jgi:hypothetical protein